MSDDWYNNDDDFGDEEVEYEEHEEQGGQGGFGLGNMDQQFQNQWNNAKQEANQFFNQANQGINNFFGGGGGGDPNPPNNNNNNNRQQDHWQGWDNQEESDQQPGFGQDEAINNANQLDPDQLNNQANLGLNMFDDMLDMCSPDAEYDQTITSLKGGKYRDPKFQPNDISLYGDKGPGAKPSWANIVWLQPEQIFQGQEYHLFNGEPEPNDIKQGQLGDCYFLAALSGLAEKSSRIKSIFSPMEGKDLKSLGGCYTARIMIKGQWRNVIVDDFFPCDRNTQKPFFTQSTKCELWVMILEKVWAKVYHSYLNIEAGFTRECLHDFSGAPTRQCWMDEKNLWESLVEAERRDWIMSTSSKSQADLDQLGGNINGGGAQLNNQALNKLGIVSDHAYTLLSALEIKDDYGNIVKLVRIRNPWGEGEWKGDWSDNSELWTDNTTSQVLRKLGQNTSIKKEDGIFFMDFRDMKKCFADLQICMLNDGNIYSHQDITCQHQKPKFYRVDVKASGKYYFTVNQDSERLFPKGTYKYSNCMMLLGQTEQETGKFHAWAWNDEDREIWVDGVSESQPLHLFLRMDWRDNKPKGNIGFSCYGPGKAILSELKEETPEVKTFIVNTLKDRVRRGLTEQTEVGEEGSPEWSPHPSNPRVEYYMYLSQKGWGYFYYKNSSGQPLSTAIMLKCSAGVVFAPPYQGTTAKFTIPANKDFLVPLTFSGREASISYSHESSGGGGQAGGFLPMTSGDGGVRGFDPFGGDHGANNFQDNQQGGFFNNMMNMGGDIIGGAGSWFGGGPQPVNGGKPTPQGAGRDQSELNQWIISNGIVDERQNNGEASGVRCWVAKDSNCIYYLVRNNSGKYYKETVHFELNNCRIKNNEDAEVLEFELHDGDQSIIELQKVPYAKEFSMNFEPKFKFK